MNEITNCLDPGTGLSPEHVAKVTAVLTRPMTALEFADLFWPERVKKVKQPGRRSRAGHALLNMLVRRGLVRRKKSSKGDRKESHHSHHSKRSKEKRRSSSRSKDSSKSDSSSSSDSSVELIK